MRASYQPLRASARRLESPFSCHYFGILLVALELLLPMCSGNCNSAPKFQTMKTKISYGRNIETGRSIEYVCKEGHSLINASQTITTVCQADGTWEPALQEGCTIMSCTRPPDPKNGRVVYVNGTTEFGSQIHFVCNAGYNLVGTNIRKCEAYYNEVVWSGLRPKCEIMSCPKLQGPQNGKIVYDNGSSEFGSQVHYVCTEGYKLVGKKNRKCEANNTQVVWSGTAPKCEKIVCQPPARIPNGDFSNGQKSKFGYNETVTYSCNPSNATTNYTLVGESRLVCIGPNKWSSEPPECNVTYIPVRGSTTSADDLDGRLIAVIVLTVFLGVAVVGTCV